MTRPEEIKNILIYRCGTIGDAIVAVPAINLLRNYFGKAVFSLMTANDGDGKIWAYEIFSEFNWFKSFVTYSSRGLKNPRNILSLMKKISECNPDLVVYMASDKNSAMRILRDKIFFQLCGIKRFVPFYSPKVTFWGHLRRADRLYPQEVVRLTEALKNLGIESRKISFDLPVREKHVQKVLELVSKSGVDPRRLLIGMCPWSKMEAKRWPLERYAQLGERLIKTLDVNVAIVGGKEEAMVGEEISQFWPKGRWAIFAGKLSILETAELLRRCSFYVGNDTGAMHLAAAMGTPSVAIFSARDQKGSWYPFGDNHTVLRRNVPCQNCYLTECQKHNLRCLKEISFEEVWVSCQKMFEILRTTSPKIPNGLT